MKTMRIVLLLLPLIGSSAFGAPIYIAGVSPELASDPAMHVGKHLLTSDATHPTVLGAFGGISFAGGDALDGDFVQSYDTAAANDLADGQSNRGDADFSMLIWDMGAPYNSLRLYPEQDHYPGGPITDPMVAQDVMEYSVWGSHDGDNFVLLSDTLAFNIDGAGPGVPTFTYSGAEPTVVYREGSIELGLDNAYVRDYVFDDAYQYFGVRTSTVSLAAFDADPEVDALAAFHTVPEPTSVSLLLLGAIGVLRMRRR